MSVADIIRAFGWIPVAWLLTVHLLIRFGRAPRHGSAIRIAGWVAALTIMAAALATRMWPIAALGLLFMRTELLGHRHADEREAHRVQDLLDRFRRHEEEKRHPVPGARTPLDNIHALHDQEEVLPDVHIHHGGSGLTPASARHPEYTVPGVTAASAATLRARTHDKTDPDFVPATVGLREPHHETHHPSHHPSQTAHPATMRAIGSAKRFTDLLLKVEIIAVVVVALVLFGIWAEGQRREFTRNSDSTICKLSYSC
ncbi:hypothetical protein [Kineosporia sp. NBRC 101731]|uniref:hypothetical protein n=1 Tax=Kineosporia sp. NBRC 101731 TaxID=3032199 RepID=UPI0024A31A05|nr:hypothetical protein [Kineosporia sp. NBRC 101731]GLY31769.1 hypothetical protein Kisp02_51340 [Kineosporia sp. NBRC 101731]